MIQWVFDPALPSGARTGGNAAWRAFSPDIETFVREVLQNASDAGLGGCVEVDFRFIELAGAQAGEFLRAMSWHQIRDHIATAGEEPKGIQFREAVERIEARQSIKLLVIEDRHTSGLVGPETARNGEGDRFTALCRDELYSSKSSNSAGGSHGMGKAVLWHFSGISTVLFNSTLADPDGQPADSRFIGRASLPWHRLSEAEAFHGGGWLGTPAQQSAVSVRGEEARETARSLCADRATPATGTSILVVDFHEPAEPDRPLEETARAVENAAAKWFWPSMAERQPSLAVTVEVVRNGAAVYSRRVDASANETARPFVQAWQAMRRNAVQPELASAGDVALRKIPVQVPAQRQGEHGALTASATLAVRLSGAGELGEDANSVAYFRGAGMVVRYRRLRRVPLSGGSFHAVLACGEARGSEQEDVLLERFLRAAEPPEHNRWTSTDELKHLYVQPYARVLSELDQQVKEALQSVLARGSAVHSAPVRLLSRFRSTGPSIAARKAFELTEAEAYLDDFGVWQFKGVMVVRDSMPYGWQASIKIGYANEEARIGSRVAISSLEAEGLPHAVEEDTATILVPPGRSCFEFRGRVDARRHAVPPQHAVLSVSASGLSIEPEVVHA